MHRATLLTAVTAVLSASASGSAATYVVTTIADSGAGSFRQAILNANANPGTDFIEFNIAGSGVRTILPTSPLPVITGVVAIDGSTQPGFVGVPLIEIGGDIAGASADGLVISGNSSQVGWLTINGFGGNGICITGSGNATVIGCYIGVNNDGQGVTYPNVGHGVFIHDSPNNDIGGSSVALRNIIAGNEGSGIRIEGFTSTGNVVSGNYVGTNVSGTVGLGNGASGILLYECGSNTVGGSVSAARNVVSGHPNANVLVVDCDFPGNTIAGNRVGVNAAGTAVIGSSGDGIVISRSPASIVRGNLCSGNGGYNIDVSTFSEGTVVEGNLVGTDVTGMVALGGGYFSGINLFNVCNVRVGGASPSSRNVISGNAGDGYSITGSSSGSCSSFPNELHNNYIGVAIDGTTPLGNGQHGVVVSRRSDAEIGGGATGANVIAFNGGTGVLVTASSFSGVPARHILISRNSIYSNSGLGIDLSEDVLEADGVTPNDPLDPDTGANELQNYPVIQSASGAGFSLTVSGVLDSTPSTTFRIEFFGAPSSTGHSEGRYYLGALDVGTSAVGIAAFGTTMTTQYQLSPSWFITATARNLATNDTSEFSAGRALDSDNCTPDAGSCFIENGTPGCSGDADCCDLVCDVDPYCCDVMWDEICVAEAVEICGGCGTETSGDCYTSNGTPGCYDSACCATVCAEDPYCCEVEWDEICANEAIKLCADPCAGDVPLVSPGVIDVQDLLFVLASWGDTGPPRPRGDVAPPPLGDNEVNIGDLLEVLARWGECRP